MENENTVNQTPGEKKGLSIASLVLGIVSLALFCITYVSLPCAILAIIFGILGKKKGGAGMAKAGLIMGIIALTLVVLFWILAIAGIAALGSFAGELGNELTNELNNFDFNSIQY